MSKRIKKTAIFIGLTFLVNWSFALLFVALGGRWGTPLGIAFGAAYMFVPMSIAILLQKGFYREPVREPLGVSFRLNRWFLVAWFLPPVIALATFGVSLLLPGVEYSPEMQGLFERFASLVPPEQMQQLKEQMAGTPVLAFWLALLQGRDRRRDYPRIAERNLRPVHRAGPWRQRPDDGCDGSVGLFRAGLGDRDSMAARL